MTGAYRTGILIISLLLLKTVVAQGLIALEDVILADFMGRWFVVGVNYGSYGSASHGSCQSCLVNDYTWSIEADLVLKESCLKSNGVTKIFLTNLWLGLFYPGNGYTLDEGKLWARVDAPDYEEDDPNFYILYLNKDEGLAIVSGPTANDPFYFLSKSPTITESKLNLLRNGAIAAGIPSDKDFISPPQDNCTYPPFKPLN